MATTVLVPFGILTLIESKAKCPHCERDITLEELEPKWIRQANPYMRMKCKCKRFIGITCDMRGDFVAYKLLSKKQSQQLLID